MSKGYGLFAFNTDFSPITNQESPSRCLAIQQKNNVGIYSSSDSQLASDEITLNNSSSSTAIIKPIFVNVDGQLRIVDAEFSNQASDQNPDGSDYIQLYTYIRKWWFANNAQATSLSYPATYDGSPRIENDSEATLGDWTSLQSYIFPPTTYKASTDRETSNYIVTQVIHY